MKGNKKMFKYKTTTCGSNGFYTVCLYKDHTSYLELIKKTDYMVSSLDQAYQKFLKDNKLKNKKG